LAQQKALKDTLEHRCRETEGHLGRLERELQEKVIMGVRVCGRMGGRVGVGVDGCVWVWADGGGPAPAGGGTVVCGRRGVDG
jgi:hypothetical protein